MIRLLIARGIAPRALKQLPQTEVDQISPGEADWIALGHRLSEKERLEFASLIRFLQARWELR